MKEEIYDNLWRNEWKVATIGPGYRTKNRIILKLLKKYGKGNKILDIGCGNGSFLSFLPKEYELQGIDPSKEGVKQTLDKGINASMGDITKSKTLPKEKFNIITFLDVIEHLGDDNIALKNIRKMLKDNGLLLLSTGHSMKYWTNYDEVSGHKRRYEVNQMKNLLEKNNFKVEKIFCWGNLFYKKYYFFKIKNKEKVFSKKNLFLKKIISNFLYNLFKFEDYLDSRDGIRLYAIANK